MTMITCEPPMVQAPPLLPAVKPRFTTIVRIFTVRLSPGMTPRPEKSQSTFRLFRQLRLLGG